jgi:putative transposase
MQDPFPKDLKKKADEAAEKESSAGVPPAVFIRRPNDISIRNRGHQPHWELSGAVYFVTFRIADSLPQKTLQKIKFARADIPATVKQIGRELSESERKHLSKLHPRKVESYLDAGAGTCPMRNPALADMVADSLRQFDGSRYRLFAWCVMPNHVHAVFQTLSDNTLAGILHSWKSYSAKKANKILRRSGEFWQHEYYDRLIRDGRELDRAVLYVANNPRKARLKDWRWVWTYS